MSKQSVTAPSSDLFSRKGSAKPAGQLIAYERKSNTVSAPEPSVTNGESTTNGDFVAEPDQGRNPVNNPSVTAGSVFSIEFRKGNLDSESETTLAKASPPPTVTRCKAPKSKAKDRTAPDKARTERRTPPAPSRAKAAGRTIPPVGPAAAAPRSSRDHGSHYGLLLALITVGCLVAGVWFVLDHRGEVATPAFDLAIPAPESARAGSEQPVDSGESTEADTIQDAGEPVAEPSQDTLAAASTPEPEATETASAVEPSFDLIRVEPNGEAVIAGRAAPNAELILLDNGEPIGTVTANWAGEWAFIPETPLEPGDHQFSLVVSTPQGTVSLPASPDEANRTQSQGPDEGDADEASDPNTVSDREPSRSSETKPATEYAPQGSGTAPQDKSSSLEQDPPVPPQKPKAKEFATLGGGGESHYMIQLSSTNTLTGAEKEWLKLRRIFPHLLNDMKLDVQKVNLDPLGTRYRVQTGLFIDQVPARALCREFRSLDQDCLVVKR